MTDWSKVPVGSRVVYSRHYLDNHSSRAEAVRVMDRVGTLMDVKTYPKDNDPLHYPGVLWDDVRDRFYAYPGRDPNEAVPDYSWGRTHPDNVVPLAQGLTEDEKAAHRKAFRDHQLASLKAQRDSLNGQIAALEKEAADELEADLLAIMGEGVDA